MKNTRGMVLIVVINLLVCAAGNSLSGELAEVVVTGSRVPVGFSSTTRDVTVIVKEDIEKSQLSSVPELLSFIAGLDVQNRGNFGVQSDITVRGSTFQQVLVLIDGVRVNDSQTAHHNMDIPLDVGDIQRIEILHGHSSAVYGADAFGGVINIITKDSDKKEADMNIGWGQRGSLDGSLHFSNKWDKFGQRFSCSRRKSNGFRYGTEYDIMNISGISTLELDEMKFRLSLGLVDKRFGAYDFYTPGLNYPSRETTRTRFINLQMTGKVNNILIKPKVYWRRHYDNYILDRNNPDSYNAEHVTYQYGGELSAQFDSIAAGFDVSGTAINSLKLGGHNRSRYAVFTEYSKTIAAKYDFNTGLRFDHYSGWGWNISPSIGFGWCLDKNLKLRFSSGKAFRVPSYIELYNPSPMNTGNPALSPEEAISFEAGLDYDAGTDLLFKLSVFDRIEYNLIDWVGLTSEGPWVARNIGEINRYGIESSIRKKWKALTASVKYSWNGSSTQLSHFSKYSLRYPQHQLCITLSSVIFRDITGTCRTVYKQRLEEKGYLLVHLLLAREVNNIEFFIKADNILDTEYEEVTGVPCPGRWLMAGMKLKVGSFSN